MCLGASLALDYSQAISSLCSFNFGYELKTKVVTSPPSSSWVHATLPHWLSKIIFEYLFVTIFILD